MINQFSFVDILRAGRTEEGMIFVRPAFSSLLIEELESLYALSDSVKQLLDGEIDAVEFRSAVEGYYGNDRKRMGTSKTGNSGVDSPVP